MKVLIIHLLYVIEAAEIGTLEHTGDRASERLSVEDELLAIKDGEWSLTKVQAESDRLFKLAEEAHAQSDLPKRPDPNKVSTLCHDVIFEELFRRGEIP